MRWRLTRPWLIILLGCIYVSMLWGAEKEIKPVTPGASKEARALLKLLYDISGKYTLTGQHNFPNVRDRNSQFAAAYIGETPVIWSTDMGFAKPGDTDSYLARPDIVDEAICQHQQGSIITICWHAVPPTADEPVTFRPPFGAVSASESLATVQGQLLDRQFRDVLTPGTTLYKRWCAQVDTIAVYLKKLQRAKVPILWRPYHEMNGNWFWWGGRLGKYGTAALYRQIFDRLVKHHKLNNLIWVWSVDRPHQPEMNFSNFYPGDKYLDVLALDVYGRDFNQAYYDSLVNLSKGRPVVLGEVGNPPTPEILANQPRWGLWVVWASMVRNTLHREYEIMVKSPRIVFKEDSAYLEYINQFRAACNLPTLPKIKAPEGAINFAGFWSLNEDRSVLDNWGTGNLPTALKITQQDNALSIRRIFTVEYDNERIEDEKLTLDGREMKSEMWNSPQIKTSKWSPGQDTLLISSKVTFNLGDQTSEMTSAESWFLQNRGQQLMIKHSSSSFWGKRNITIVYDKQRCE